MELYTKGKIPVPYWGNDPMWGGDEVGFDPNGKLASVYAYASPERLVKHLQTAVDGEKAPFWVTMFFWMRCDGGQILDPCVVYQGTEKTGEMHETFMSGAMPKSWITHCTPSGYADQNFFAMVLAQLSKLARVKPCIAIVDGHESHENAWAWRGAQKEGVYGFFLKSHDSSRDQIGDNGANAIIKAVHARATEEVKGMTGGTVNLRIAIFNSALMRTWDYAVPLLPKAAHDASEMCGWLYVYADPKFQEWIGMILCVFV